MSILDNKYFHNEAAAYSFVESKVWPDGPVCPHCGAVEDHIGKLSGKSTRVGLYKCYACRKPFTVKIGTIFESSHVKLHIWLQAIFLMASSKKGISANQLHRTLGVTLKTAWFMAHRIREAMKDTDVSPMGGQGQSVEVDETYFGSSGYEFVNGQGWKVKRGLGDKHKIVTLVERGGRAKSVKVDMLTRGSVHDIIEHAVAGAATIMTDESKIYTGLDRKFKDHQSVNHSKGEYARGFTHTNTVEGYFSIFKRGMKGVYQHCSERHLHRYLAEFDFRYTNRAARGVDDVTRADRALRGIVGKRLTYQTTRG